MFIELVDALRCPVPHEESWLVAAAARIEHRHIVQGTLGCPVCSAEYPIADGVVYFRRGAEHQAASLPGAHAEPALRLAAMLDLTDAQGFAVLLGRWGSWAEELSAIVETSLILVDPPVGVIGAPGISVLRTDGDVPLASGAARAMAIDEVSVTRAASAVRATRTRGRVVAPSTLALPEGVRELARDDGLWVAEREPAPSPLITLHVRRGVIS